MDPLRRGPEGSNPSTSSMKTELTYTSPWSRKIEAYVRRAFDRNPSGSSDHLYDEIRRGLNLFKRRGLINIYYVRKQDDKICIDAYKNVSGQYHMMRILVTGKSLCV